jgi:hypothetical protein
MNQVAAPSHRQQRTAPPKDDHAPGSMVLMSAPIELKPAADGALPARFEGIAYSGNFVPDYEVVIDMATTTFKQRLPLLDSHWRSDIVGVVEQAANKDGAMSVSGRLFSDMAGSSAERIAQLAQRGVPFEMSVGLFAFTREWVPAGKSVNVNGQVFNGPVNVLRNGQVREVSIVTLGADPRTDAKFFHTPSGDTSMQLNLEQLTTQVAELTAQAATHAAALAAAREEAAGAERQRIQAVFAQGMPGHDALIAQLAFDGKTTGPEAAVAVLQAERKLRGTAAAQLAADAPAPVKPVAAPAARTGADASEDESLPLAERCKAAWDKNPDLRAEFSSLETFTAWRQAQSRGAARVLTKTA